MKNQITIFRRGLMIFIKNDLKNFARFLLSSVVIVWVAFTIAFAINILSHQSEPLGISILGYVSLAFFLFLVVLSQLLKIMELGRKTQEQDSDITQ